MKYLLFRSHKNTEHWVFCSEGVGLLGGAEVLLVRGHPVLQQVPPSDNISFPLVWEDRTWEDELMRQTKQISHHAKFQACTVWWCCQRP